MKSNPEFNLVESAFNAMSDESKRKLCEPILERIVFETVQRKLKAPYECSADEIIDCVCEALQRRMNCEDSTAWKAQCQDNGIDSRHWRYGKTRRKINTVQDIYSELERNSPSAELRKRKVE